MNIFHFILMKNSMLRSKPSNVTLSSTWEDLETSHNQAGRKMDYCDMHRHSSGLPACEHGRKNWCGCQIPGVCGTACHIVHSRSWPSHPPEPWLQLSPSQHSPAKAEVEGDNLLQILVRSCFSTMFVIHLRNTRLTSTARPQGSIPVSKYTVRRLWS